MKDFTRVRLPSQPFEFMAAMRLMEVNMYLSLKLAFKSLISTSKSFILKFLMLSMTMFVLFISLSVNSFLNNSLESILLNEFESEVRLTENYKSAEFANVDSINNERKLEIIRSAIILSNVCIIASVSISSIFVLLSAVMLFKKRIAAIGTLLVWGMRKKVIIRQLIMEVLILYLASFLTVGIVGTYGSEAVSKNVQEIISNQIHSVGDIYVYVKSTAEGADKIKSGRIITDRGGWTIKVDGLITHKQAGRFLAVVFPMLLCGMILIAVRILRFSPAHSFKDTVQNASGIFKKANIYAVIGQTKNESSALLLCLAGLMKPVSGEISFEEGGYKRNKTALLLQEFGLIPDLTAAENIALRNQIQGMAPVASKRAAIEQLEMAGFDKSRYGVKAAWLSWTEQQQIMVLRAAGSESTLVLIEAGPWNKEPELESCLMTILDEAAHKNGCCVIICTDSRSIAVKADEVWGLKNGVLLPVKTQIS